MLVVIFVKESFINAIIVAISIILSKTLVFTYWFPAQFFDFAFLVNTFLLPFVAIVLDTIIFWYILLEFAFL